MRVPPGISERDFAQTLEKFASVVGHEWVFSSAEDVALYRDAYSPFWGEPEERWASSPIGNSLDRGGGYTMPQYRLLPSGELMRTGQGAMPGSRTWQEFKNAVGPSVDGLFSQANYGVVTKMGFWLMPEPEAYLSATVFVARYHDLVPLVDAVNWLENSCLTNGIPELYSPVMKMAPAGGETPSPELRALIDKAVEGDASGLDAYGQSEALPAWSCKLKFYGPPGVILEQWNACKARLARIAGATFDDGTVIRTPLSAELKERVPKAEFGIPALSIWGLVSRTATDPGPHFGHQGFSPIIPRSGEAVFETNRIFARAARDYGVPVPPYSVPHCYWQRAFMFVFLFPVSKDPVANAKARNGLQQLVKLAADAGLGEYRCAPAYQDVIARTYSFNNNALLRFQETLKDAIDPNGIMSPGRYGIWPRHLRSKSA